MYNLFLTGYFKYWDGISIKSVFDKDERDGWWAACCEVGDFSTT